MVGVVPSTLHQKVKFVVEEQLINVAIEKDIIAVLTTFDSYIDVFESVIECSFQSLEVVNARLSKVTKTWVKQTG